MQNVCLKISSGGSCGATYARSLYANPLCISLCQDRCIRILHDHLSKISLCGFFVQHLSVTMSASGSCRITCARSLCADLLSNISRSGSRHKDPVEGSVPARGCGLGT